MLVSVGGYWWVLTSTEGRKLLSAPGSWRPTDRPGSKKSSAQPLPGAGVFRNYSVRSKVEGSIPATCFRMKDMFHRFSCSYAPVVKLWTP